MVKNVIKRDGEKVKFNSGKIKKAIEKCMMDIRKNKFEEKELSDIFKTVLLNIQNTNEEILEIEKIQDIVVSTLFELKQLDLFYSFTSYREKRREVRERELGKKISDVLFKSSEDNDSKRENGNVDGDTPMGTMLQAGSTVTKHYGLTRYPKYISEAHEKGDIHIHDLDFDAMGTTTCTQIDLKQLFDNGFNTGHGYLRPPRSIRTASALTAIVIQANQNSQHGGQAIPMLDYYLAPYVLLTYKQIVKEFLQMYLSISNGEDIDKYKNEIEDICENKIKSIYGNHFKIILEENFSLYMNEDVLKNMHNNIMKKLDKEVFQSMEGLVHNLNTMHSRAGM